MKLDKSSYEPFGLEAIEMASRDEIAALQVERLKRTLKNVYENVPAYRKKFDAVGVAPSDFKHLDDLEKFPYTTKQDLRENYPFGMFAVPKEHVVRVHASSGTTGKPTVVGYTRNDINTWADWSPVRFEQVAPALACSFTSLSATAYSPGGWECTMGPNGSAAPWSLLRAE